MVNCMGIVTSKTIEYYQNYDSSTFGIVLHDIPGDYKINNQEKVIVRRNEKTKYRISMVQPR